jgi:hypothetical protein
MSFNERLGADRATPGLITCSLRKLDPAGQISSVIYFTARVKSDASR